VGFQSVVAIHAFLKQIPIFSLKEAGIPLQCLLMCYNRPRAASHHVPSFLVATTIAVKKPAESIAIDQPQCRGVNLETFQYVLNNGADCLKYSMFIKKAVTCLYILNARYTE